VITSVSSAPFLTLTRIAPYAEIVRWLIQMAYVNAQQVILSATLL